MESTKEIFEWTLDTLRDENVYILDLTERVQASLNLYIYLVIKERNWLKQGVLSEPILTEAKYQEETIRKKYFDPMNKTIKAGFEGLEDEKKKIDDMTDETVRENLK